MFTLELDYHAPFTVYSRYCNILIFFIKEYIIVIQYKV